MSEPGPTVLDALSLLAEVADELVVGTARDTHLAIADRAHGLVGRATGNSSSGALHRGIAGAVYTGLGLGLRAASTGLDKVAATGVGPRLEATPRGRFVSSAVNGLIGDSLLRERPQMAIPTAVRQHGRDVEPDADGLAEAFPDATGRLVVFLHGLCENESYWNLHRDRTGTTYGEALAGEGWTPVYLRANTGLSLRENGVAVAALVQRVVDAWPVPVERIALVGHSMGGLVMRAAGAVAAPDPERDWNLLVTDVVTLGCPHLGAPDRVGDRPRQPRSGPATHHRTVRPDPRQALDRRPRPRGGSRRGRAAAAARPLPAGVGHRHRLAAPPGRSRGRRPAGAPAVGLRPRPPRSRPLPRGRPPPRRQHRPLRHPQPPARAGGAARVAGLTSRPDIIRP